MSKARVVKWGAGLILFVLVAGGLLLWLAGLPRVLDWAVRRAEVMSEGRLVVGQVRGSLYDGVHFDQLQWTDPDGVSVEVQEGELDWNLTRVLDREVHVALIKARSVLVKLGPPSDQKFEMPESLKLPVALQVDDVVINSLAIQPYPGADGKPAEPIELQGVRLAMTYRDSRYNFQRVAATTQWGTVEANAQIDDVEPFLISAETRVVARLEGMVDPIPAQLAIGGSMQLLQARGSAQLANAEMRLSGLVRPLEDQPFSPIRFEASSVELRRFVESAPEARFRLSGVIEPKMPEAAKPAATPAPKAPRGARRAPPPPPAEGLRLSGNLDLVNEIPGRVDEDLLPINGASTRFDLVGNTLKLIDTAVSFGGAGAIGGGGTVDISRLGSIPGSPFTGLDIDLKVADVDLARMHANVMPTRLAGTLDIGDSGVAVELNDRGGGIVAGGLGLRGVFNLLENRLTVRNGEVRARDGALRVNGQFGLDEQHAFDFKGTADRFEPQRWIKLPPDEGGRFINGRINGQWATSGRLQPGLEAKISAQLTDSRLNDLPLAGRLEAELEGPVAAAPAPGSYASAPNAAAAVRAIPRGSNNVADAHTAARELARKEADQPAGKAADKAGGDKAADKTTDKAADAKGGDAASKDGKVADAKAADGKDGKAAGGKATEGRSAEAGSADGRAAAGDAAKRDESRPRADTAKVEGLDAVPIERLRKLDLNLTLGGTRLVARGNLGHAGDHLVLEGQSRSLAELDARLAGALRWQGELRDQWRRPQVKLQFNGNGLKVHLPEEAPAAEKAATPTAQGAAATETPTAAAEAQNTAQPGAQAGTQDGAQAGAQNPPPAGPPAQAAAATPASTATAGARAPAATAPRTASAGPTRGARSALRQVPYDPATIEIGRLRGQIELRELGVDQMTVQVNAGAIRAFGYLFDTLTADLDGTQAQHEFKLALAGSGQALRTAGSGQFQHADPWTWTGQIRQFDVSGAMQAGLQKPATVTVKPGAYAIDSLAAALAGGQLRIDSGRIEDGRIIGRGAFGEIALRRLLEGLERWKPGTVSPDLLRSIDARAAGQFDINGTSIADLSGSLGIRIESAAMDSRSSVDLKLTNGALQGPLQLRIPTLAWARSLMPEEWRIDGRLGFDGQVSGRVDAPRLSGDLKGEQLSVSQALLGWRLTDGRLDAHFDTDRLRVETLRFASAKGSLALKGELALPDPGAGRRVAAGRTDLGEGLFQLDLDNLPVSIGPGQRLVLSGATPIRIAADTVRWTGAIQIVEGLVELRDLNGPAEPEDLVIIADPARPDGAARPLKTAAPQDPKPKVAEALPVTMLADLEIDAGHRLRIVGSGVDASLAGKLRVSGRLPDEARGDGTVQIRSGKYRGYGQDLDIVDSRIVFDGPLDNPQLDIRAVRRHLAVEAGVSITGLAQAPRIRLVSTPEVPDAEKLSWMVLGVPTADASGQSVALQAAAAALFGAEGSSNSLTDRLGVDVLSFGKASQMSSNSILPTAFTSTAIPGVPGAGGTTTSSSTAQQNVVTVGKRLSSRLFVSYEQGLQGVWNLLKVQYDISRRLSVRASTGTASALDLLYFYSFD